MEGSGKMPPLLVEVHYFVPNHLPTGKKAGIRSQIDLPNSELHCATVEVRLECAGEMSAVDCLGPFCSYHIILFA